MDYPHPEQLRRHTVAGHVVSGDSYVSQKCIDHIDFLKIDVEGMEDKVLRGFGSTPSVTVPLTSFSSIWAR